MRIKRGFPASSIRRLLIEGAVTVGSAVAVVIVWCALVEETWGPPRGKAPASVFVSEREAAGPVEMRVYPFGDLAEEVGRWDRTVEAARVYNVDYLRPKPFGSWAPPTTDAQRAFERMRDVLYGTGRWTDLGRGDGTVSAWNGLLIVRQTAAAHARIERMLGALRAAIRSSGEEAGS